MSLPHTTQTLFSDYMFLVSHKIYSGLAIFPATAQLAAVLGDAR